MLHSLITWSPVVAGVAVAYYAWEPGRAWLLAPLVAVGAALLVGVLVEPFWRYRVHRWEVTDNATYASAGWLVLEWRAAPMSRIQTVDAVRGPLEQLLGLSTLRVTTASARGAIVIVGLPRRVAQESATRLAMVVEVTEGDAT